MFLQGLNRFFSTFGSVIFVPIVFLIINLFIGTGLKKAVLSALYVGVGLTGFTWIINAFLPLITPVIQNMVKITGIHLPIVDLGWEATAVVAYATKAGMYFLGIGLLFQLVLYLVGWTNIFLPTGLWDNYSYMIWGSLLYMATQNMLLSVFLMLLMNLYVLLFAEVISERWSTYYGYAHCTITQLHNMDMVPFAIAMNWLLNKFGLNKIKITPKDFEKRWGFIGSPAMLGLIIGFLLGFLGNLDKLNTLSGWANIATIAVSLTAIMLIFPRIAALFAQAFVAPAAAFRQLAASKRKSVQRFSDTYLAVDDAVGYGEENTIITGTILIPIMVLLAALLPGNGVLPLVDLIAIPFIIEVVIAITNGNIFKTLIISVIWLAMGLYICTITSPLFTKVYSQFTTTPLSPGTQVTGFAILSKPLFGGGIFLPILHWGWIAFGIGLVVYFILYFLMKKHKKQIHDYMEKAALE
jgi:PTS system galactitol-specific IIC component